MARHQGYRLGDTRTSEGAEVKPPTWDSMTKEITMEVRISRKATMRMRLACQLMRLAAWVLGTGFEVQEVNDEQV